MKSIDLAKMRSDYGLFNVVLFMNRDTTLDVREICVSGMSPDEVP